MGSLSENARGAIFMMIGMAGFVFNDTLMKMVSNELTVYQAVFLRGLMVTVMLAAFALNRGVLMPRIGGANLRLLGLRLVAEIGGTTCFLTALFHMQIANTTAILQSMPLAVTLAAALFLGEPVGWRRYAAITVGFVGVLIIIRPGSEGFSLYSLWALAAIGFMVLRDLSTRRLSRDVPGRPNAWPGPPSGPARYGPGARAAGRRASECPARSPAPACSVPACPVPIRTSCSCAPDTRETQ